MSVKCTGIIFFALTCAFLSLGAAELKNVAQHSLGTIITSSGAPCNKDWPVTNLIFPEENDNRRRGCIFGAGIVGAAVDIILDSGYEIERVDLKQLDYRGTMNVKKVEIFFDGRNMGVFELQNLPGKFQEVAVQGTAKKVTVKCVETFPPQTLKNGQKGPNYGGWARIRVMSSGKNASNSEKGSSYKITASSNAIMPTGTGAKGKVEVFGSPRKALGHPRTIWDKEDVKLYREMLKRSPLLQAQAADLKRRMDRRITQPIDIPQPVKRGGTYIHVNDNQGNWGRRHRYLSLDIANLGFCYQLYGEEKYAEFAKKILLEYAKAWPKYGVGSRKGFSHDPSKVYDQRLGDAIWLIPIAHGFDFIREYPGLTDAEAEIIKKDLVAGAARFIAENRAHYSNATNWSAIGTTAMLAAALACDDDDLFNFAMYGANWVKRKKGVKSLNKWWEGEASQNPSGVELHFSSEAIDVDGMWCEGAMGYQFMALQALVCDAEMLWRNGIDLYRYRDCAMKQVFDSPLYYVYPDFCAPAIHDSGNSSILGYDSYLYEYGYLRYKDPKYLEVLNRIERHLDARYQQFTFSCLYDKLDSNGVKVAPSSVNLNGVGYGILRVNDAKGTRNLLLDYGPNRSHGHPDKLNIDLWAFGNLQIPDPGIVWYEQPIYRQWYRTTFAHNTLNVDMSEQEACGAELLVYAANNSVGMMRARTDQAYYGVMMDRTVVMTKDYIADLFGVSAISPRILDVTWHPRGNLVKTKTTNPTDGSFNLSSPVGNGYNQLKGIKAWKGKSSFEAEFDNEGIKTRLITADDGEESTIVQGFADIPNNYREGNSSLKQYPIFVRRKTNETVFSAAFDYSNSGAIKSVKKLGSIEEGFGAMAILTDTTKDALVCSYRDAKVIKAYGIETDAQSAFVSRDASGRMIHVIMGGGTRLSAGKFELKASEKISVTIERTSKGYIVKNASPVDAKITVAVGGKSHRLNLKANAYSHPL